MKNRRQDEINLLKKKHDKIDVDANYQWFIIRELVLSEGWNKHSTDLLVLMPSGYPNIPPDNFYTDHDLRVAAGNQLPNCTSQTNQLNQQWLQFSFHVDKATWKPHAEILQGHNLLTFVCGVVKRLSEVD